MGLFGNLLQAVPGVLAARQQGKNQGEQEKYKRGVVQQQMDVEAQARKAALDQQASEIQQRIAEMAANRRAGEAQHAATIVEHRKTAADAAAAKVEADVLHRQDKIDSDKREADLRRELKGMGGGGGAGHFQFLQQPDGSYVRGNAQTGAMEAAVGPDGKPVYGRAAIPSTTERTAGAYHQRALDGETTLSGLGTYTPGVGIAALGMSAKQGGVTGALANKMLTSHDQQFLQGAEQFINAVNRRDSGANITKQEWESAFQRYLPQVGDDPKVIAQKAASRRIEIQGLQASAGRAFSGGTPGGTPDAAPHAALPDAGAILGRTSKSPPKDPATRWEELVNGGLPEPQATAQVKREFKLP